MKAFSSATDVEIQVSESVRTLDHVERTIFLGNVVEKAKAWLQGLDSLQVACRRQGFCTRTTPGMAPQPWMMVRTNRVPTPKTEDVVCQPLKEILAVGLKQTHAMGAWTTNLGMD
jgi:hypothetical protein